MKSLMMAIMMTASAFAVGAAERKGGVCGANAFTGANTVFNCEHLGRVTIKEIYEKGWSVVAMGQKHDAGGWTYLVIEEQR